MRAAISRLLAVGSLAAAVVVAIGGHPAAAVAPSATGYWVKSGQAPPNVPTGGLFVGDDPGAVTEPGGPVTLPAAPPSTPGPQVTGYTAVSAVRISAVSTTDSATLTLAVAPNSVLPQPAVSTIVACPVAGPWQPPAGGVGDISAAPPANCATPSVGRVAADNGSISFVLPVSFQTTPGEFDVEILPGAGVPAPFAVAFNPPGPSSVTAASGEPLAPPPPAAEPAPAPPPTDAPAPALLPSSSGIVSPAGPTAAPPAATAPVAAVPTVRLVAPQIAAPATAILTGDDRAHRIMAVVILIGLAVALWFFGSQTVRAPRRLGAFAGDVGAVEAGAAPSTVGERGVGRFRHLRFGPAPHL